MREISREHPVAILGATGQLGSDIVRIAQERGLPYVALGHEEIEITEPATVEKVLEDVNPSVVINSAAFHAVDACEKRPGKALEVNGAGARHVAQATHNLGARTLYISTDYVFDGTKPAPQDGTTDPSHAYLPSDPVGPVNVYGTSKLVGEQLTLQADSNALVARVSSLFGIEGARGKGGGNFVDMMLNLASEHGTLQGVDDQWMTPTYTREAAKALLELASIPDAVGRVHVTSPTACTWYDLAKAALQAAGDSTQIERVGQEAFAGPAEKPKNSSLNTDRLEDLIGRRLPPWPDMVEAYVREKRQVITSGTEASL